MPKLTPTPPEAEPVMRWSWRASHTDSAMAYVVFDGERPSLYCQCPADAIRATLALNMLDHLFKVRGICPCNIKISNTIN